MIDAFVGWLAATPLSLAIGEHQWVTPSVQIVHIMAIAAAMAAILMTDLKALGAIGREEPMGRFSHRYVPWLGAAMLVLLLSGSLLIVGEPKRSLQNPVFILKMGLFAGALVVTAAIHAPAWRDGGFWQAAGRAMTLRALAVVSLGLWSGIVFAGRWIAYAAG